MKFNRSQLVFFELVRAGLWEQSIRLSSNGEIDYQAVYHIAEEQSVVGLVTAGLEHVIDERVPKDILLTFVGSSLQIEQRNNAMNEFVAKVISFLRGNNVFALLLKGQGLAQCYNKPLWRSCGDVDLLLDGDNYHRSLKALIPMSTTVEDEIESRRHIALTIDGWTVEIHGSLRSGLWKRIDKELDQLQKAILYEGSVRSWMNGRTMVFLPRADEDVVFVFSHILQHFFREGIGLRQVCDWCRLLWTYRSEIDVRLLEQRLCKAGMMSEWKAFAALAVDWLGMPVDSMPLYSSSPFWKRRANRIMILILEAGNFGHNKDMSYINKRSFFVRKVISCGKLVSNAFRQSAIFPLDSVKVWNNLFYDGAIRFFKGE